MSRPDVGPFFGRLFQTIGSRIKHDNDRISSATGIHRICRLFGTPPFIPGFLVPSLYYVSTSFDMPDDIDRHFGSELYDRFVYNILTVNAGGDL